jgi:hypothetical protein
MDPVIKLSFQLIEHDVVKIVEHTVFDVYRVMELADVWMMFHRNYHRVDEMMRKMLLVFLVLIYVDN